MGKPLRVLIIEDSDYDVKLLLQELRRGGYDVTHAQVQTADAVRETMHEAWDIVLSDYSMPAFSALAALRIVQEAARDIPFIVVSGTIGEEAAVEVLTNGANDFLAKGRLTRLTPAIERELREARMRRERRAATALLDTLYETAPIGLVFLDHDLRYRRLNEFFATMSGIPVSQHLGRDSHEVPGLGHLIAWAFPQVLHTCKPMLDEEVSGETPAIPGEERHWTVNYYPVRDNMGLLLGVGATVTDVTARKRSEERLRAAVQARDTFLAVATHELKTPLTSLKLQVQSLARKGATHAPVLEVVTRKVAMIDSQVRRLETLVTSLLDVVCITSGRFTLSREHLDLTTLVSGIVDQFAELFRQAKSEITLEAGIPISGHWDKMRLDTVITNLFSNAIKFGAGKPIDIRITTDGHVACLSVADHGIGMSSGVQKRIFDKFERAVSERHYGGLGLGLWIVRQIVDAHAGTIDVTSEEGKGSKFTVRLPLQ